MRKKKTDKTKVRFDLHARELPAFSPGERVAVRDPATNTWGGEGTIKTSRRDDLRSFDLVMSDGQQTIRNRKDLRPLPQSDDNLQTDV